MEVSSRESSSSDNKINQQKNFKRRKNKKPKVGKINEITIEENGRSRNGIVFYTNYNGERQFLFAIDAKTKQLTDFGGTYSPDDGCRIISAIRESEEETMGVITGLTVDKLQNCIAVCDHKNLIIFVPIEVNPTTIVKAIENRVKQYFDEKQQQPETISATWISGSELTNCITRRDSSGKLYDNTIYSVVGEFLHKAGNFQKFF